MENNHFFAMLARMKYINRWGLMNNTKNENICEHSLQVAFIAHALVLIANKRFGENLNPERAAVLGMFHDASEIITGDMPTPVKYYNPQISKAYKDVEKVACQKLISMLPEYLREDYNLLIAENDGDKELLRYVKAADKLSALIKCIEEIRMGNKEFEKAHQTINSSIENMDLPALKVFCDEFLPSFYLTLDEQD